MLAELCDPEVHSLEEAGRLARGLADGGQLRHAELAQLLRAQCTAAFPNLALVERALRVAHAAVPASMLIFLLKPILRDSDPRVQSKCYLLLARHEELFIAWAERLFCDDEARIRANVIEGLWGSNWPKAEGLFARAIQDSHHRVVGNGVYGLYLLRGVRTVIPAIQQLQAAQSPAFRCVAAWLVGKIALEEVRYLLAPLLKDRDRVVKQSALQAASALDAAAALPTPAEPIVTASEAVLPQ
jgi:hypothetical protein